MSDSLCTHCQNLAAAWLVPRLYDLRDSTYPAHKEPVLWWTYATCEALEVSSKTCHLCALILREAKPAHPGSALLGQSGVRFKAMGASRLEVWCSEQIKMASLNVALTGVDALRMPAHAHDLFDARIVSKRTGDSNSVATIKHWLSVCQSSHTKCLSWASSTSQLRHLPTRVLDVGPLGCNTIKLFIPSDADNSKYIALSYCWGPTGNPYVTDRSNFELHIASGFDIGELPLTLRDAVRLTQSLGLRYLWIDALCIIQKDHEDWVQEAARMSTVYSHAIFTIAADASMDTSTGLLLQHSTRSQTSVPLPWPLEAPDDGLGPLSLHITPTLKGFKPEIEESPLARRGWTFQERALSKRVLHIGSEMCYWECKEACIGEDHDIQAYSVQDGFSYLKDMLLSADHAPDIPAFSLHDKWAWVISQFSIRLLTNANDVFAALEGVATIFAAKNKLGKYFCGLWETEFPRHLLWSASRDTFKTSAPGRRGAPPHRRPPTYRAPTWSWAAICGPVENAAIQIHFGYSRTEGIRNTKKLGKNSLFSHAHLRVREIKVETEGSSGFGPVIEAVLKVTGNFYPIRLAERINRGRYFLAAPRGDRVGEVVWDVDEEPDRGVPVWVCPVMQLEDGRDGRVVSECLVLRAADVNYGGELSFERVGKGRSEHFWGAVVVEQEFTML